MNSGTVITEPGSDAYGPSVFQAVIGNPSPISASQTQLVDSSPVSWLDTLKDTATQAVKAAIGPGPAATDAVAKGVEGLGQGAKSAGAGISAAATSASSGIKIGAIILVILIGIILIAQVRGALKA